MGETGIEFRSAFEETIGGTVKQRTVLILCMHEGK